MQLCGRSRLRLGLALVSFAAVQVRPYLYFVALFIITMLRPSMKCQGEDCAPDYTLQLSLSY